MSLDKIAEEIDLVVASLAAHKKFDYSRKGGFFHAKLTWKFGNGTLLSELQGIEPSFWGDMKKILNKTRKTLKSWGAKPGRIYPAVLSTDDNDIIVIQTFDLKASRREGWPGTELDTAVREAAEEVGYSIGHFTSTI